MKDYKRTYFCLKKWVEEIQNERDKQDEATIDTIDWIVATCENEIFNGQYLDDKEYNEMLILYKNEGENYE